MMGRIARLRVKRYLKYVLIILQHANADIDPE